jgi:predicted HTH transcriptional regulator
MNPGLPLDPEHLLSARRVESERVEYKASWDPATELQIAKTVCAFANDLDGQDGGYVVVGVTTEDGVATRPVRGVPASDLERVQQRIRVVCKWISPEYHPRVSVETVDGRNLVFLRCFAGDLRPYDAPTREGKEAPRAYFVRRGPETVKADGVVRTDLLERSQRTPFDARRHLDARPEDVSSGLVAGHLQQAGSSLLDLVPDPAERLRRMDLLVRVNGHEVPRNAALLFFAHDPRRWFAHARIEAAVYPDGKGGDRFDERTFEGPLPDQLRACLAWLRGVTPTAVVKAPDRAEAVRAEAWPFAAVEEAVTNAIVHRGYDQPAEPIVVEVLPDALVVLSYPGPVRGVQAADFDSGEVRRVPARNRRVGELLKEIGLSELRATGVHKIRRAMARNGSPPPRFTFDDDRTFFEVRLPIHPAHARPAAPLPLRPGQPCPPEELVGRGALVEALRQRIGQGVSTWLVGPRGRGKTSVLEAVARATGARLVDLAGVEPVAASLAIARAAEAHRVLLIDHAPEESVRDWWQLTTLLATTETAPEETTDIVWSDPPAPGEIAVLVERLVAGTTCPQAAMPGVRDAVVARAGVNPAVPHLLLHALARAGTWTPEAAESAWAELLLDPRDLAGLHARVNGLARLSPRALALLARLQDRSPTADTQSAPASAELTELLAAGIVARAGGALRVEI